MSRVSSVSPRGKVRSALTAGIVLSFLMALVVSVPARRARAAAGAPELLTQGTTTRAVALESVTWRKEPFSPTQVNQFGTDNRTRIILFAKNLDLQPGEGASVVTAEAEDSTRARYPLAVEYAGGVPGFDWLGMIVVRLHDAIGKVGDVLIGIRLRGVASNRVRVGIGRTGGGPPDDTPGAQPDLGPNASLHGKQVFPADNAWNQDISGRAR